MTDKTDLMVLMSELFKEEFVLSELFNEELFEVLPDLLTEMLGRESASMILRESMRTATKNLLRKEKECDLRKYLDTLKTNIEKISICYILYNQMGHSYTYEIENTGNGMLLKVVECPHADYVKKNPAACEVCQGIKLGILEELYGIRLAQTTKHSCIADGDSYCVIELPVSA